MKYFTIEFWKGLWDDFVEFMGDLPIQILKKFLDGVLVVLNKITPPEFMSTPISDHLGPIMEYIGFFLSQAGITQAFAMLLSAFLFRLSRKAITLGRW